MKVMLGATPDGHIHYDIRELKSSVHFDIEYDQRIRADLF